MATEEEKVYAYRTFLSYIRESFQELQAHLGSNEYLRDEDERRRLLAICEASIAEIAEKEDRYDNTRKARQARSWESSKA